jgi:hypothetical protein
MIRIAPYLAVAACTIACGSSSSDDPGEEGCGYVEREVSLDADFAGETPRQVMELLERPVDGPVTFYPGTNEYVAVGGATSETHFHAEATAGPTAWVREGKPGMGGVVESRIFCPTEFLFDATVRLETSDGALAEEWRGRATYGVSGVLGSGGGIAVDIVDPRPFAGSLTVEEREGVDDEWESRELDVHLHFKTNPLDFLGMTGGIRHYLSNETVSEGVGEGVGVTSTIAEFRLPPG